MLRGNNHYMYQNTGGGTPSRKAIQRCGTTPVPGSTLPSGTLAKQQYETSGGTITPFGEFGRDPLRNRQDLVVRRDSLFAEQNPPFNIMFSDVVSGNGAQFRNGILSFITLTESFQHLL